MARYELVREQSKKFGKNNYMEVSRKKLIEGDTKTDFILVTRGYFDKAGARKWRLFVTIPDEPEVKAWLAKTLTEV